LPAYLAVIETILGWDNPGHGSYYDDLGNSTQQPHLVQQKAWAEDPGYVDSTQNEFSWHNADPSLAKGGGRLSWQDQAETLYGTPLQMRYEGLDPLTVYDLQVTYVGRFGATMTLTADGSYAIHGAVGSGSLDPLRFDVPQAATADGVLELSWGLVGGRGCQVAEVWLRNVGPPRLVHIAGGVGPDPAAFISPTAKSVGCDSVGLLLTHDVTLVASCTTSTGGSPASVESLTQLGEGVHRLSFGGPIEIGEWTTVELTVESPFDVEGTVCFQVAHLPGDCNQDGQTNSNDATSFGQEFPDGAVLRADLNGDGQINLNDATKCGQILNGTSGEGINPDGTGSWLGEGLPTKPPCACGP